MLLWAGGGGGSGKGGWESFPLAAISGLLAGRKPVTSDLFSIQEWELWVPLAQPGGPSLAYWGHLQPGHPQSVGPLISSEGRWPREPDDELLVMS